MKIRLALAILVVLAFTLSAAYAGYERISDSNYTYMGWKKTLVTGSETGQNCNMRAESSTIPAYVEGVHPSPKKASSSFLASAAISKQMFDNKLLSSVTSFNIRVTGYEGDGASWEPPTMYIGVTKEGINPRHMRALPYRTFGRGTAKTFYTYNLMESQWYVRVGGDPIYTWAAWIAAYPSTQFATAAQSSGLATGQNFNVMAGAWQSVEVKWGSSARGTVDYVEIGFDDGTYCFYDFVVPEPGSIVALAAGLIGFIGLRRRF